MKHKGFFFILIVSFLTSNGCNSTYEQNEGLTVTSTFSPTHTQQERTVNPLPTQTSMVQPLENLGDVNQDFLQTVNIFKQMITIDYEVDVLYNMYLSAKPEAKRALEITREMDEITSEIDTLVQTNGNTERINELNAELSSQLIEFYNLAGINKNDTGFEITDEAKNQDFIGAHVIYKTRTAIHSWLDQYVIIFGIHLFAIEGSNLDHGLLLQVFEPYINKIEVALMDGDWSEDDASDFEMNQETALLWVNDFEKYLNSIEDILQKSQSDPSLIKYDDFLFLLLFQEKLSKIFDMQIGLERANIDLDSVNWNDHISFTVGGGQLGLSSDIITLELEEGEAVEKGVEGKNIVFCRIANAVYAWEIVNEAKYSNFKILIQEFDFRLMEN